MTTERNLDPRDWKTIEPYFSELATRELTCETVAQWLQDWSDLKAVIDDAVFAAYRAASENTADEEIERQLMLFISEIQPQVAVAEQELRSRLLEVEGFEPQSGMAEAFRRLNNWAGLFRDENVPIEAELGKLENNYNKIVGGMVVTVDGEEKTMQQTAELLYSTDPAVRSKAWHAMQERWLQDRTALDDLYLEMLSLRRQMARNAGLGDFREYMWRKLSRFSYTPADCAAFHKAIEQEVVPLARKYAAWCADKLGCEALLPWDTEVDPCGRPALRPFSDIQELIETIQQVFDRLDPVLGQYFMRMRDGNLDLESRRNKAPGAYCGGFHQTGKPYIFANFVGVHDDVNTMLHESGHAFHFIECSPQSLIWNKFALEPVNYEFGEVASMGMELLGAPYLTKEQGGFYTAAESARARADHLLGIIRFLPYMAVVDGFQHWVYAEAPAGVSARDLDRKWGELWDRFMSWQDWRGLDDQKVSGWHRKGHIFGAPFYYVEYGLAQLGAIQVWRNAMRDPASALKDYRFALSLGNTRPLPELYEAAGAKLVFDAESVGRLMRLVDEKLDELLKAE